MMKGIKFVALIALLFSVSCASSTQKKLLSGYAPNYSGEIIPITTPVQLRYKPVSLKEKTIMAGMAKFGGESRAIEEKSVEAYKKISRLEDLLLWEYTMTAPIIVETKMLTDVYGNVKKVNVFPPEDSDMVISLLKENFNVLPQNPVRSGDVFNKINAGSFLKKLFNDDNSLPPEANLEIRLDMESIIRGWVYFEGKKAMLVSTDSRNNGLDISGKGKEIKLILDYYGYQLVDADTLQNLYSEFLMVIRMEIMGGTKKDKGVIRMLTSTKSEFY